MFPQIELMKFLSESKYWQRSKGRDHVIPMTHPNAFRFLRNQVNASIQIVVDFGRYPKTMSNLRKDVVAPYVHVVSSFIDDDPPDPYESRPTLLFFQGKTFRKDVSRLKFHVLSYPPILKWGKQNLRFDMKLLVTEFVKHVSGWHYSCQTGEDIRRL